MEYIYISYIDWCLFSSIVSNKAFIRWWLGVQVWFRGWNIITTNPERPSIPPDFVGLMSFCGIAISMLMQLEPCLESFFMYFLLSDEESPRLVKNTEVELVMKTRHLTAIGNMLVIQLFLTHHSCWSSYFSNLHWCALSKFPSKGSVNSITTTFLIYIYIYIYIYMLLILEICYSYY